MGLYGNILTAADGSIFTFDKIYDNTSGDDKNVFLTRMASSDKVFVGRFIFLEPYGEVYMKTVVEEEDQYVYKYVLIASLQLVKDLAKATKDDWIGITQENGVLNIIHRGPKINNWEYKKIDIDESQYEKNKFYIKNESGEYGLCDDDNFSDQQNYYILTQIREDIPIIGYYEKIEINDSNYEPNKYYYQNSEGDYILSTSAYESDKIYYNFIEDFNQTIYLPKINYDRKGHIENVQPIAESDDFTLILNGGAFLNNNNEIS